MNVYMGNFNFSLFTDFNELITTTTIQLKIAYFAPPLKLFEKMEVIYVHEIKTFL